MTQPAYQVISAAEAEQRFGVGAEVEFPFQDFADDQETRLYPGDLHIDGDFGSESDGDWVAYNTIVDGNLTVSGDLDWWDFSQGNFLLVTGSVRAGNLLLSGCPNVVVRGDLTVTGGVQGHHGDDGGLLVVNGHTSAAIVVSTLYFRMDFGQPPSAVVLADPYRINVPVDFTDDEIANVVMPDLLDSEGRADEHMIETALKAGRPILRPTAVPSHLAALAELDALVGRADEVTALDLGERKLRRFPEQLFAFTNLRVLSLAGNDLITTLPSRIGELTALEELDLSGLALTELPDEIGDLVSLRVLDISDNELVALPERLGDLSRLTTLSARSLACALPQSFAALTALEELDLYRLSAPAPAGPDQSRRRAVEFPLIITRLPRLRRLDLSMTRLADLPDELLDVTTLEELSLNAALGLLRRLPELSRLPRLRVLHLDGRAANAAPYPRPDLLDQIWSISTLEELGIDRWGEQTAYNPETRVHEVIRAAWTDLPADAFSRLPELRRLDLSFNAFTTLPESFYGLRRLEQVDLRYTKLDRDTLDRLGATFGQVRLDLRDIEASQDVDDPHWREVHQLVAQAGQAPDREAQIAQYEQALARCVPGARFSPYDQLYAAYRVVDGLGHLCQAEDDPLARAALSQRLIAHAEQALSLVPEPGTIWHFTDLGAFQEEVTRRAGNALAWHLMQQGELDRALAVVDRALTVAGGADGDYIRDTRVRILLAAGRADEAYLTVDQVLTRAPDFVDFQDLRESPDFLAWRRANTTGVAR